MSEIPFDDDEERPPLAPEVDQARIAAAVREILEAGCSTPPPAWPGCTPRSSPGSTTHPTGT
jgi:hypothetical protein